MMRRWRKPEESGPLEYEGPRIDQEEDLLGGEGSTALGVPQSPGAGRVVSALLAVSLESWCQTWFSLCIGS